MSWVITTDFAAYDATAGAFVRSRPARHTVQLTVAERIRHQGPDAFGERAPEFGWWTDENGAIGAAVLRTPPYPVLLTALPDRSVVPLARAFALRDPGLSGATGPDGAVRAFSAAWQAATGARIVEHRKAERLYRLGELTAPPPAAGQAGRLAEAADRDLLTDWYEAFARDIGEPQPHRADRAVEDRMTYGGLSLWEAAGRPVSMAGRTRAVAGMVRVAPVYTPEALRGRGYAAAATAAVCRSALAEGVREVLLFTDLGNPTSNALYLRLGFRPVADHRRVRFV